MRRSRFSEEQIIAILGEQERGLEVVREVWTRGYVEFLPEIGMMAECRSDDEQTTPPEPQPGFQGESSARRDTR